MSSKMSMPQLGLLLLALILAGAALAQAFSVGQQLNDQKSKTDSLNSQMGNLTNQITNLTTKPANGVRTVYMTVEPDWAGTGYDKFFPETAVVLKGDTVKIVLNNTDTMDHGFAIDAYGISQTVTAGNTITIQFVANQAGIFEFYCTVPCGPGHTQMTGHLAVLG